MHDNSDMDVLVWCKLPELSYNFVLGRETIIKVPVNSRQRVIREDILVAHTVFLSWTGGCRWQRVECHVHKQHGTWSSSMRLLWVLSRKVSPHLDNCCDVYCTIKAHEIEWQLLKPVCPVLKLVRMLLQIHTSKRRTHMTDRSHSQHQVNSPWELLYHGLSKPRVPDLKAAPESTDLEDNGCTEQWGRRWDSLLAGRDLKTIHSSV